MRDDAYFAEVLSNFPVQRRTQAICISHMVPNALCFLSAVSRISSLALILPKPKTANRAEAMIPRDTLRVAFGALSREWADDAERVVHDICRLGLAGERLVIIDIGGYFASSIDRIAAIFPGEVAGVMEGTENGARRYEAATPKRVPIITVARSPLKEPENYLAGSSVVFSIEAVLREQGQTLNTRSACVIGYGRVGRGVASALRGRGVPTSIHDSDPIALAAAVAHGYTVHRRLERALNSADLIVCSSGNTALDRQAFAALQSRSIVATVTSSDDELNLRGLEVDYEKSQLSPSATCYMERSARKRYFWLINDGNAANFMHGAVIGPAIRLIEGEKLVALQVLADNTGRLTTTGLTELGTPTRRRIASIWSAHYLTE